VSDPKPAEPDDDLLEFLGGIDEVNDDSRDDNFTDFLANADIERIAAAKPPRQPPPKDAKNE
jgi:hypothetical protein